MSEPKIFIWYNRHLQLQQLKCDMTENHSKLLMIHMWLWEKDEPDPISLSLSFSLSLVIYIVNKDTEAINHLVYISPIFPVWQLCPLNILFPPKAPP